MFKIVFPPVERKLDFKSKLGLNNTNKVISLLLLTLPANGYSRVMLTLARGFIDRGFKVDIVVLKAEGEALIWVPERANIVELKCQDRGIHKLRYLFSLTRYLKKRKPTALICGDGINFGSIAKFFAKASTQVVVTSHISLTEFLHFSPEVVRKSFTAYLLRRFLWFYDWADHIVSVSQGVANDLLNISHRPLERLQVIYNPVVTPELFTKAKEPVYHPWFEPGQPPVILGVGRFNQQKDFPTLMRAFALVRQHINARLMILGDGTKEERYQLEAVINELGLTDEIALPGWVNNPYAFMSKAAVFVLSSAYEGLPSVLIEAMAVGTPVVSTNCPSGPAEILDSKYGELVPVGDVKALAEAIINTLNSPVYPQLLRERANKFSLETAVDQYLEVLGVAAT